jgi:hypothetical protein
VTHDEKIKTGFGFEKRPACSGQFASPGGDVVPKEFSASKELPAQIKLFV